MLGLVVTTTLITTLTTLFTIEGLEERIAEVRKYPSLYNPSQRDYQDVQKTTSSWREIAEKRGLKQGFVPFAKMEENGGTDIPKRKIEKKREKLRDGHDGDKSISGI